MGSSCRADRQSDSFGKSCCCWCHSGRVRRLSKDDESEIRGAEVAIWKREDFRPLCLCSWHWKLNGKTTIKTIFEDPLLRCTETVNTGLLLSDSVSRRTAARRYGNLNGTRTGVFYSVFSVVNITCSLIQLNHTVTEGRVFFEHAPVHLLFYRYVPPISPAVKRAGDLTSAIRSHWGGL